jgi:Zinc finger, C3HC4 type (RING finger)
VLMQETRIASIIGATVPIVVFVMICVCGVIMHMKMAKLCKRIENTVYRTAVIRPNHAYAPPTNAGGVRAKVFPRIHADDGVPVVGVLKCLMCHDREREWAPASCGHFALCTTCLDDPRYDCRCLLCRRPCTHWNRIYQ